MCTFYDGNITYKKKWIVYEIIRVKKEQKRTPQQTKTAVLVSSIYVQVIVTVVVVVVVCKIGYTKAINTKI